MSNIPPGYKQTEIGIIPDDWDVIYLKDITTLITNGYVGSVKSSYARRNEGVMYVQGYNVKENSYDYHDIRYVNLDFHNRHKKSELHEDDLLTIQTGEIGVTTHVPKKLEGVNCHALIISRFKKDYISKYFCFYFNSSIGRFQLKCFETGTTMKHINVSSMRYLLLPIPSSKEQAAIAEALSDMEALIEATEKLIAKKKAVKQGAMQQLLTGKKRLPGFTEKWETVQLEQTCKFIGGGTPSKRVTEFWNGNIPWISSSDIFSESIFHVNLNRFISERAVMASATQLCPQGTVLIVSRVGVGKIAIAPRDLSTSQDFTNIIPLFHTNKFVAYYLQQVIRHIGKTSQGTSIKGLPIEVIKSIYIPLPSMIEQEAIAKILSDMDDEIEELEKKLTKYRQIKQGMMSELLTGRIRLPYQQSSSTTIEVSPKASKCKKIDTKKVIAPKAKGHSAGYNDAVIMVGLVNSFGSPDHPFTAFDCQKFPYLLHRHLEGKAQGYKKFAAGPYNPTLVYKTAKPIALKKKYIREHVGKYKGFILDENAQEALKYFAEWFGEEPLKWLEQFRFISKRKDELELLTTVDMAMVELRDNQKEITVPAVKKIIQNSEEWKAKLKRELFTDVNIARAIQWSYRLFGKEEIS